MSSNEVARRFLLWLYENNAAKPAPEKFLVDQTASADSRQIDQRELDQTIELLAVHRLIDGAGSWQKSHLRAWLTNEGVLCVREFGGDVAAWSESKKPRTDQSVTINSGANTQVVAFSSNVSQSQIVDISTEHLKSAVPVVEANLDEYEKAGVNVNELRQTTAAIKDELACDAPDESKLRKWGKRLAEVIAPTAGSVTVTKFVLDMLGVGA